MTWVSFLYESITWALSFVIKINTAVDVIKQSEEEMKVIQSEIKENLEEEKKINQEIKANLSEDKEIRQKLMEEIKLYLDSKRTLDSSTM